MLVFRYDLIYCFIFVLHVSCAKDTKTKICKTPECVRTAKNLLESMDPTVHPCDDFYRFACGNWGKVHPTKTNYMPTTTIQQRTEVNSKELLGFLRRNNSGNEPKMVHNARRLFSTCLKTANVDKKGIRPIRELLKRVHLSENPPLFHRNKHFDLVKSLIKLQNLLGIEMFFSIVVTPDPFNQTMNKIGVARPGTISSRLPKSASHRVSSDRKKAFMFAIFNTFCENSTASFCRKHFSYVDAVEGAFTLQAVQEYLQMLIQVTTKQYPKTDNVGVTTTNYSLSQLQSLTNSIAKSVNSTIQPLNWTKVLEYAFENCENVKLNFTEKDKIELIVEKEYIQDALKFIHTYSLVEHEMGLWWTVVDNLAMYSSRPIRESRVKYIEQFLGTQTREQWCADTVSQVLGLAVSHYYTKEASYNNIKTKIREMVNNIRGVFKNILIQSSWMDEVTRAKALNKTDSIRAVIGYPDFLTDKQGLDKYYSRLKVSITDSFLESVLNIIQRETKANLNSLHRVNDLKQDRTIITPITVNAFFDPERNTIIIPAGILGFPIFGNGIEALNYGLIGSVIGHEITHSFDTQVGDLTELEKYNPNYIPWRKARAPLFPLRNNTTLIVHAILKRRHYNFIGNVEDWWEKETLQKFQERSLCFVRAYSSYIAHFQTMEIRANSLITLAENIADNGGFKEALYAYRKYVAKNGPEPLLPQFENFTHDQLYTLGFANMWCEQSTFISAVTAPLSDHSPNAIRVNGAAMNSEDFPEIWNCPKGSNMNPTIDKCQLW